jgi:hypothetical protein
MVPCVLPRGTRRPQAAQPDLIVPVGVCSALFTEEGKFRVEGDLMWYGYTLSSGC